MRVDYSVSCQGDRYASTTAYVIIMITIYPIGIPLLYLGLLWHARHCINPVVSIEGVSLCPAKPVPKSTHSEWGGGFVLKIKSLLSNMVPHASFVTESSSSSSDNDEEKQLLSNVRMTKELLSRAGDGDRAMLLQRSQAIRSDDKSISHLKFLFEVYEPQLWWWEGECQ